MFDQTPINRIQNLEWEYDSTGNTESMKPDSHHGVRHLLADISELVELQARLTASDVRASLKGLIVPIGLLALAAIVLLGTLPVVLLAVANAIVVELQWPSYAAQFASGSLAIILAIALVSVAVMKLKKITAPLNQSANELSKNFESIRDLLRGQMHSNNDYPSYPR
jgi:hypothetical protein